MSWTLRGLQKACDEQWPGDEKLNQQLRDEMFWNEGYRCGRRRWYWGPMWVSSVQGWLNTQIQRMKEK